MKAYLKKDPERIGRIAFVYTTDWGQKRFTVEFENGNAPYTVIDDAAENFEVVPEELQ